MTTATIKASAKPRVEKNKVAPIRCKIECLRKGGKFPGFGLYLTLVDRPEWKGDDEFNQIDGTFLGFSDLDHAKASVKTISDGRVFMGFRPLVLVD